MTVVIVSERPLPGADAIVRPEDELVQARSLPDALRQISASNKPREVILTTMSSRTEAPAGIQVLKTPPGNLSNAVRELAELHEYLLWVKSSTASANVKVVLTETPGLPPLRLTWN